LNRRRIWGKHRSMADAAQFQIEDGPNGRNLRLSGDWVIARVGSISDDLRGTAELSQLDLSGIGQIDTVGAWLIHRTIVDTGAVVTGASDNAARLLDEVMEADRPDRLEPPKYGGFVRGLDELGDAVNLAFSSLIGLVAFFGRLVRAFFAVLLHPRRIAWRELITRFEHVGVRALGIIGLMSFLIGIVIAQQGSVQLRQFGAEVFTVNLIGRLTFRELGVLMTAIMVAGRSGSAFAAQLGTMKLTEEIDAMRTIGVSPAEALVLPRVVATIVMMPLLGFYASLMALLGGGLYVWAVMDMPPITYVQRIREVVPMTDFYVGMVKAPVFGAIIAMAGCFQGMQVEGNAEEIGKRTTAAVVQAIFMVIVLDAFFAVFFGEIGWV
jgi:phospholipid/cholesterol/gamma-HCH transport system permease protein